MVTYRPDEREITNIRNRFRDYHPNLNLHDYEIRVEFQSSEKAYVYLGSQQFRFEREFGRCVCTRGIGD